MKWLREAISDDAGLADMAYLVIGALAVSAICALAFIFAMSAIDYRSCMPATTVQTANTATTKKDERSVHVTPCRFDPLPVGQSAGLIFGAFATLIGALSAYMMSTRRGPKVQPAAPTTVETTTTTTVPASATTRTTKGGR